ncbi:hypothetical protein DPMN_104423 [Dreissena polymorpha]|uniref:Uncharacterized protein n=1 Tax=Dreissena polymorpha TaxID=45954 RepID=A0A9D4HD25_DREPO|nr:hypothetical protein DPMN_104423 [Dreissena polymorpha]
MSRLREAQEKVKAELAAQISNLEAEITACWEELHVRWLEEAVRALPTVQDVVGDIGVCTDGTEGGNDETVGVDDAVPLQLPTFREVVRHIGVCTDMSTVRGNGETGGVGDIEDVLTEGVDDAVPLQLPTFRKVVRHIWVCTDMSTVRGNGETGGVGGREDEFTEGIDDALPLQLPIVREVVRHIGVCTDMSTVRGNGETGGVCEVEATAEGENSCKPNLTSRDCPVLRAQKSRLATGILSA